MLAGACNVTRSIPEGQHLLDKNIIKSDRTEFNENVNSIIKQKPNRKILGIFRFHLGVYNLSQIGKETKFKKWLKTAIGEQPVLLDTGLTFKSTQQISIFFQNNGYFNADINDTTIYKKKKAKVIYTLKSGKPYKIRNISYNISDTEIRDFIFRDSTEFQIKSGDIYSVSLLQSERERISIALRNNGYYNFNPQYITYQIDSSLKSQQVDVWLYLTNPKISNRDIITAPDSFIVHKKNYFKDVYIEVDYDPISVNDTIAKDTTEFEKLKFISRGKLELRYKAKHLAEHIFIRKDSIFSQSDIDLTYKRLSDLGIFKFVNIRIEPEYPGPEDINNPLRCYILLSPQARQEYKIEFDGTNNGGNFGILGNLSYRNKNIFKGAESFNFRIKAGLELQQNFGDTTYESTRQLALFNAYEVGPEISLNFPRGLWPFHFDKLKIVSNPITSINAGFNTQNRPEYFRQLFNLSYSYSIKTTKYNRIFFYPADLNYLKVKLDPAFTQQLNELGDPNIILGYVDHFISTGRLSYIFNNQDLKIKRKYFFFRANLEFAGNSIYLAKRINNESISKTSPATFLNVRFAQYIRPDFDIRLYSPVGISNALAVFRIAVGLGVSYGNSLQLPFEKSFFAGGPNDIRAWRTRQLGPGTNDKEDFFERFGDLKLTGNFEYRFDIYRKLKGAAFLDAGNIWIINKISTSEDGKFKFDTFADQIALGSGLGIRFDFTFFILRMDGAIKIKDPALAQGERWVLDANELSDITFNFGIGYPF
jgi:outer membrane translocation and assembly module TamA